MTYEELNRRYGTHVSQRIRRELSPLEFEKLTIETLPTWLETRAEQAHDKYRLLLSNPLLSSAGKGVPDTRAACQRWREAEDLAYLVAIAEDITTNAQRVG